MLEGRARAGGDEADVDGGEVVHAPDEGDDTIAAISGSNRDVVVVRPTVNWPNGFEPPPQRSFGRAGCSTSSSTEAANRSRSREMRTVRPLSGMGHVVDAE